jgi:hypothetical protein
VDERIDLATPLGLHVFPAAETHGDEFDRGEVAMGTKDLIGAASATIAKFLWCVIMISEGAPGQAVQRRAVSVLGGVHAGIKGIWRRRSNIEFVRGSAAH